MSDAPERIWASVNGMSTRLPDGGRQFIGGWSEDPARPRVTEYVRADIAEALESRCRELEAEVTRLRTALAFIKHGGRGANSAEQKVYIARAALSADASPAQSREEVLEEAAYRCPVCGSPDPNFYLRCNRPDCTDGRDPRPAAVRAKGGGADAD